MQLFGSLESLLLALVRLWPLLLVGLVAVVVLRSRATPSPTPLAPGAALPSGRWRARVVPMGEVAVAAGHGTLRLYDGWLDFVPDGSAEPAWVARCRDVIAAKHTVLARTDLRLWTPATGGVKVALSRDHGRWAAGLPGDEPEPSAAASLPARRDPSELLWLLGQSGARVS